MAEMRTITLPKDLCSAAEQKFGHRFGSLEEFLVSALTQLLLEDALVMDSREQQIIEERLKGLGYI
jgi:hypothetical protein